MKFAITGSTGLVGSALVPFLRTKSHQVLPLVRTVASAAEEVTWDPIAGKIDAERLEGLDAVIHLAGENIASRRWNLEQKARIRDSRVNGTRLISETLAKLQRPPQVLVCASAIGYYGDQGEEQLTEASSAGSGFLVEVCRDWEKATETAGKAGIRVANMRFGVILSGSGGALASMLTPFRLCLGGKIGSGRQWISWLALDDAVGSIYHALTDNRLCGPVNAVAPQAVTNRDFTKTLGKVLRRPTIIPMPAFMARLAFGEMANELLLASTRVVPRVLLDTGYRYLYGDLETALRHVLGRDKAALPGP
jgi:uncharacterized protein (TIGR01777 family)